MAKRGSKRKRAKKAGYRSGFEQDVAASAKDEGIWFEYEPGHISYQGKPRRYTPDFRLKNGIYVETKGRFKAADREKHLAVKAQHPEIEVRFVFMIDAPIYKGSTTYNSDWCETHGFKYAMKRIPKEWALEKNKKHGKSSKGP